MCTTRIRLHAPGREAKPQIMLLTEWIKIWLISSPIRNPNLDGQKFKIHKSLDSLNKTSQIKRISNGWINKLAP